MNYRAAIAPWISPDPRMTLAFATLLAIMGGIATVLLSEFWSRRLRSRHDVEREIGLPLAGVVPDAASMARLPRRRYPAGAPTIWSITPSRRLPNRSATCAPSSCWRRDRDRRR